MSGGTDLKPGMIRTDAHMHTAFSTDSSAPVEDMLEASAERGLAAVCITDHMDLDFPPEEGAGEGAFLFDTEEYFRTLLPLREKYKERLEVRIGIEIGLQPHLGEPYKQLVRAYPFDFVIGSVHLIRRMDPYFGKLFRGRTDAEVYRQAFVETLQCIEGVEDFDVLGHLDYVVRYGKHQAEEYSYRAFSDEIDAVLRRLVFTGKGLEMNMAGVKYGLGFPNPHPDVLRRYRELGGEIITVGADAHRPEHVGYDFEEAGQLLEACGFRYYTEFRGRKPVFHRIGGR